MKIRMDRGWHDRSGLVLALLVSFSVSAFAQPFPTKHINVYVGYGPGAHQRRLGPHALRREGNRWKKLLGV